MNKINILLAVFVFFVSVSCKESINKKNTQDNRTIFSKDKEKNGIKLMQGIWESVPYYIEHKFGDRDLNLNKYYKIINENKSLDITLKYHDVKDIEYNIYFVGFIDEIDKKTIITKKYKIDNLKNYGKYLVYINENIINTKDNFKIDTSKVATNHTVKDGLYGDNIKYGGSDKIVQPTSESNYDEYGYEEIGFENISALPEYVFNFLKKQSKKDNRDYIKEFNIKEFSQKIKVTVEKAYFYTDFELKDQRKAFLVKGDIAYLENVGDSQVQIYFDNGKVVTTGYLKSNEVEILEKK